MYMYMSVRAASGTGDLKSRIPNPEPRAPRPMTSCQHRRVGASARFPTPESNPDGEPESRVAETRLPPGFVASGGTKAAGFEQMVVEREVSLVIIVEALASGRIIIPEGGSECGFHSERSENKQKRTTRRFMHGWMNENKGTMCVANKNKDGGWTETMSDEKTMRWRTIIIEQRTTMRPTHTRTCAYRAMLPKAKASGTGWDEIPRPIHRAPNPIKVTSLRGGGPGMGSPGARGGNLSGVVRLCQTGLRWHKNRDVKGDEDENEDGSILAT
ncbi:hypothetical protein C8R47DRAFT_1068727 [Mycena vitilis]|nr:hypothetical protein C8R47DRAFT_1068727 [Mycena vitilis]